MVILLQQKQGYIHSQKREGTGISDDSDSSYYVAIAFFITCIALTIALASTLLMIVGLTRNMASLLIPHIFVQVILFKISNSFITFLVVIRYKHF